MQSNYLATGSWWQSSRDRNSVILCIAFLILVFAAGGSSRADEPAQIVVRLVAIGVGAASLSRINILELRAAKAPLIILLAFVVLGVVQLLPLPLKIWAMLPGRAELVAFSRIAGLETAWRPLSLTPDMTWNAIVSIFPAIAAVLVIAPVSRRHAPIILVALLVLIMTSAFFGLSQAATGRPMLYGFRVARFEGAQGLLANRNHQAALLACAVPIGALLLMQYHRKHRWLAPVIVISVLVFAAAIFATASRAGIVLTALAGATTWLLYASHGVTPRSQSGQRWRSIAVALVVCGIAASFLVFVPPVLHRFFDQDLTKELRVQLFRPTIQIGWQYFPFGSGLGSFVDVYKLHERVVDLSFQYLNHAHNDLIEMLIENGLAGLGLIVGAGAWIVKRAVEAWYPYAPIDRSQALPRVATIILMVLILGSLSDYPLRTPLLSVLFAIALFWLVPLKPAPLKSGSVAAEARRRRVVTGERPASIPVSAARTKT